jgi:hypothetical protein
VKIGSGGKQVGRRTMKRRKIHCYLRVAGVKINVDSRKGNSGSRVQAAVGGHASATGNLVFCAKTKCQQMHVRPSTRNYRHEKITQTRIKQ